MTDKVSAQNPVETSIRNYFTSLHREVLSERDDEETDNRKFLKKASANKAKYEDIAFIPGVEVLRSSSRSSQSIQVQVPDTQINSSQPVDIVGKYEVYEGNKVAIEGTFDEEIVRGYGVVEEIEDEIIVVRLKEGTCDIHKLRQRLPIARNVSLGVTLNPVPYDRKLDAIKYAKNHHHLPEYILGKKPLEFSHRRALNTRRCDSDLYSVERQEEGIERALSAHQIACLQGPPGTGKTRVIIELARRLVQCDHRVLIAAKTNAAVDNVLVGSTSKRQLTDERSLLYHHERGDLDVARTNPDSPKTHPVAKEEFCDSLPNKADVVASTHSSAIKLPAESFDYVIIDEATQATQASSWISMTRGETTILVGDHKQLPPFSRGNSGDMRPSFFERLYAENGIYGPDIGVTFNLQFRMDPKISAFPSDEFYGGDLNDASSAGEISSDLGMLPIGIFHVSGEETDGKSKSNPVEVEVVENQVKMLLKRKGLSGNEVGVAAAYRAQAKAINDRMEQLDIRGVNDVKVDTFDGFQGSERDAMVLSFTRSNDRGEINFLGDEIGKRRLNVALTRAKGYCALVGDWDTLRAGSEMYERLYEHIEEIANVKEIPAPKQ